MDRIIHDDGDLTMVLTDAPERARRQALKTAIKHFNDAVSPWHQAGRERWVYPQAVLTRDGQNQLVGGLTGDTSWGWLEVDDLWLRKDLKEG